METKTERNDNVIIQCSRHDIKCEMWNIYNEMQAEADKRAEAKANDVALTPDSAASTLTVSLTTLWRWAKSGYLTPIYIGGKKRYRRSDVMAILEQGGAQ